MILFLVGVDSSQAQTPRGPAQVPLDAAKRPQVSAPLPATPLTPTLYTADQARRTVEQLIDWTIPRLPRRYVGDRHWEATKKVWAGVRFRRDGWRLTTHRRWRELRHGLQTRYSVSFPGPRGATPPLVVSVPSVTARPAGATSTAAWVINCEAATPLDFAARIERWNLGVQAYSVEVTGHMNVRLSITADLSAYPDYAEIPPAIVVQPRVTEATLHLDQFHVDRISKVGGEVAEQWGQLAHRVAEDVFLKDLNRQLPDKLNRAIDRQRDALRFSTEDLLQRWIGASPGD